MEATFEEILQVIKNMEEDREKWFEKYQKAAGKRIRKNAMELKKLAGKLRKEISEEVNSLDS